MNVSGGGVTNRVILGVLIDTERETKDVSGLIPDNIGEEYLKLLNDYHKLEEVKEKMETDLTSGLQKLSSKMSEYGISLTSENNLSFDNLVKDVVELATARYNKGYNEGIVFADGRTDTNTVSYKTGYNVGWQTGVSDADNRALPGTTNYQSGYNAGWTEGVTAADARSNPDSANYKAGYSQGEIKKYNDFTYAFMARQTVTYRFYTVVVLHAFGWKIAEKVKPEWYPYISQPFYKNISLSSVIFADGISAGVVKLEIFHVDGSGITPGTDIGTFTNWINSIGSGGIIYMESWVI